MFQPERLAAIGFAARRRPNGFVASVMWLGGLVAGAAALAVGALLAIFTAAAVAVIAVIAGVLVFLAGLALRARRTIILRRRATDPEVIEAQKVGDTWVAYGWERHGR